MLETALAQCRQSPYRHDIQREEPQAVLAALRDVAAPAAEAR